MSAPSRLKNRLDELRHAALACVVGAIALVVAWPLPVARAQSDAQINADEATVTSRAAIAYDVTFDFGAEPDADLSELLATASYLDSLSDRPPATLAGLERRANGDLVRLAAVLRSEGYYASKLGIEIDPDSDPIDVVIQVTPGPRYIIESYAVDYRETAPSDPPRLLDIGIDLGAPAQAPTIVAAEQSLLRLLGQRGHPLAKIVSRDVTVDHDSHTMTVTVIADAGPAAIFGPVSVAGLEDVAPDYVDALIDVPTGAPYDQREIDQLRRTLSRTGLFTAIAIETPNELLDDASLPVMVDVTERKHRSIGAGVSFSTDAGFGGQVSWVHRNLLHHGERLRVTISGDQLEQTAEIDFRKPVFFHPDQTLLANASAGRRETDAFDEEFIDGLVGLERALNEVWRAGLGVSAEFSRVTSSTGRTEFAIFGVPLTLGYDSVADPLDPVSGLRGDLALTPKTGTNSSASSTLTSVTTILSGAAYYPIGSPQTVVLAGRGRVGTVLGEAFDDLPIDQRLFAGGANSIRGYEFQRAGPLDANGDPTGGRSLVDFGAEIRTRFLDDWGVVVFADGGTASRGQYLDGGERMLFAAGVGARYYTKVGPVRFDIAFPLNGREGVDDLFQFYVSFGQAF